MRLQRVIVLLAVLGAFACGRPEDQETGSVDPAEVMQKRSEMPAELREHLDSGYVAFQRKDAEAALAHYEAATEIDENAPAAWFGVYIAQRALGRAEEAATALRRAQELVPGATLIHPEEGDTLP